MVQPNVLAVRTGGLGLPNHSRIYYGAAKGNLRLKMHADTKNLAAKLTLTPAF
jgi:hypothetical protein